MSIPFGFGVPSGDDPRGGQGGFDLSALGAMLQQMGQLLSSGAAAGDTGPVNWEIAKDTARKAVSAAGDPSVGEAEVRATRDAVDLAQLWIDAATTLPSSGADCAAWSRAEWIEATLPAWQQIMAPLGDQASSVMSQMGSEQGLTLPGMPDELPEQVHAMLAPIMGMAKQMGSVMLGIQFGNSLGALAADVLCASDIGVPLTRDGRPALVPRNIAAFAEGLEVDAGDVRLYVAVREAAHQRLFTHVPWLAPRLIGAIEEYARGIRIDTERVREAMRELDPTDPAALQEALAGGLFEPEDTPAQRAALQRVETLLALVEGWVENVVAAATGERLPASVRLAEAMRRRRAAGGPAERTLATILGLELRPRRLREAAALWAHVEQDRGIDGRDDLWAHPDLLPDGDDLDDPESFVVRSRPEPEDSP